MRKYQWILVGLVVVGLSGAGLVAGNEPGAVMRAPVAAPAPAQAGRVTSPKDVWGHNLGDDYFLADYQQLIAYWHKLEQDSPRIHVVEIGKTAEGPAAPDGHHHVARELRGTSIATRQISARCRTPRG